ncbi:hypothetical protein SAMN04489712_13328 [Thermomonospora echinospora]|uniref:WD40-like Beta Propeller Repeat n=1 Tax=Thermomonospora echinospora TaxID=1992 RepID=A0A1H6E5V1_9ACTN|nr:hypothetical protein [Thermomonospora echinospora]SEG92364.1 hypothetical protein SAMN04489712_13328 [Thermomonospora echinospora]
MRLRIGVAAALLAGLSGVLAAPGARAGTVRDDDATRAFTITDPRITESSGLAVSRQHQGVVYTHNDSGGSPLIFAIGPDGRTLATFTLAGATARDWEGMAIGEDEQGRPALFVADIGDNLGGAWPYVTVYRVPEPSRLRDQTLRATAFRLKYEDGPRNAETVMINPRTNRLYIASKLFSGALYEAPARLRATGFNTLRRVGRVPALATDGAFAPDGRSLVIRTYFSAQVYSFDDDAAEKTRPLRKVGLPGQEQGESIAYSADGRSLLAGSEGTRQPVWKVPLPDRARPTPTPSPAASGGREKDDEPNERNVGLVLVAGIALAVGYGILRRRS